MHVPLPQAGIFQIIKFDRDLDLWSWEILRNWNMKLLISFLLKFWADLHLFDLDLWPSRSLRNLKAHPWYPRCRERFLGIYHHQIPSYLILSNLNIKSHRDISKYANRKFQCCNNILGWAIVLWYQFHVAAIGVPVYQYIKFDISIWLWCWPWKVNLLMPVFCQGS